MMKYRLPTNMKPTALLTIALLTSGLLLSCDKSKDKEADKKTETAPSTPKEKADELLTKLSAGFEKTVTALESVTDKASAEAAAIKIKEASAELSALSSQAKALESELSEEEKKAMETSAMKKMEPLMGRMTEVMQKVMTIPDAAEVLMPAIQDFQKAMSSPE